MRRIFHEYAGAIACALGVLLAMPQANATTLTIVDSIGGTFMDISGTGTALSLSDDSETNIATTVSNLVFGAGTVRVGSNGGIRFAGTGTDLGFTNSTIPSASAFSATSQVLLPFWDDVNTASGTNGEIYWQEMGGVLIIQWEGVDFFSGGVDTATFQVKIFGSGSPALAQFIYTDIEGTRADGGGSATIGYQDGGAGFNDVQWSFADPGAVVDGTVLSLIAVSIPEPGALALFAVGLAGVGFARRRLTA